MAKFTIDIAYEGSRKLKTEDLLTAVKTACNYEADLYMDGRLILSCLGFERDYNTELLESVGITTFVQNGCYNYKYTDESLNVNKVYAAFMPYTWEGKKKLQVNVHDYQEGNETEFKDLDECLQFIDLTYSGEYGKDNINVVSFLDNDCKSFYLNERI